MKFLKFISLLAVLMTAVFSLNVTAQTDAVERFDVKNLTRDGDKPKDEDVIVAKTDSVFADIAQTSSYAFTTTTTGSLTDMSTGTTQLLGPNVDDTASAVTPIGFDFYFMGARYATFSVNENGVLRLGASAQAGSPYQPLAQAALPIITAYGADQRTHAVDGKVHYRVAGAAGSRVLIVEWLNNQADFNTGGTANLTYQVRLSETTGVIEFVYGSMTMSTAGAADANSQDPQIGFSSSSTTGTVGSVAAPQSGTPAPTFDGASAVPTNNLYTAGAITVLTSAAQGSRRTFTFTPPVPTAPTALNFTGVTPTSITLNWTDAPDEDVYAIYRSTDGVTYTFVATVAENVTTYTDTGRTPSTNYFYQIYSVSEGALSAAVLTGSQTTAAPGIDSCSATPTTWSAPTSWADGTVPTSGDNVTIQTGCAITIDVAANALNLTVGGTLTYEATTARVLTVAQSVTIDSGGIFQSAATGTVTTHSLVVGTNLTNNGLLDFSTNTNTAGASITFTGAANNTFGGNGFTDIRAITINKGTSSANILEWIPGGPTTVRGVNTDVAGYLTLTNGTFKISGTFIMANRTFLTAAYTIPATAGLWLNNSSYTVAPTASSTSTANNGLLRLTQGIYNVGLTGADGLGGGTGAVFIFEGGTFNAPRFDPQNAVTFTMTAGTINIGVPAANTRSNFGSFELFSSSSIFNMSGGTINLVRASTGATPIDWQVLSGTFNYTGGVLNIGTAATTTNFNFRIRGNVPSMTIDNTANNKTATFTAQTLIFGNVLVNTGATYNLNGFLVALLGANAAPTFVNNGTVSGSTAGSRLYFANANPLTYSGTGITGTTAAPIAAVDFDAPGSVTFDVGMTNNVITNVVRLFTGNVTGANKITLGSGGATTGTVQIGNTTTPTAAGTFDVPLTFNLGTGGETVSYLRTTGNRTTGGEINPGRVLTSLTFDDNAAGRTLTVAGGILTVSGALALTNGVIVTDPSNALVHNGTATRTTGFVDGPLVRQFGTAGVAAYTFHVGEGVYSPVGTANTTATGIADLSVEAINATLTPFSPAASISRNWGLNRTGAGTLTTDLSFTYDQTDDVNGNEADYRLFRRDTGATTEVCGIACVDETTNTATVAGVSSFSRWTIAEGFVPTAASVNIAGRVTTADRMTGLPRVTVTLTSGNNSQPVTVRTNPFGYYSFEDLQAGRTYILTVDAKQYVFSVPTRVVTAEENIQNFDFTADN